jgi:diguanylate cyclase (GGDEF)-like protein
VILCDVDGLKAVNDSAGHLVGDSVLRSVAKTLRTTARIEDVVARFGVAAFPEDGLLADQLIGSAKVLFIS